MAKDMVAQLMRDVVGAAAGGTLCADHDERWIGLEVERFETGDCVELHFDAHACGEVVRADGFP